MVRLGREGSGRVVELGLDAMVRQGKIGKWSGNGVRRGGEGKSRKGKWTGDGVRTGIIKGEGKLNKGK